nr:putative reverse transcriptase domain-containing protein [Tanacetum cinerariifolium]
MLKGLDKQFERKEDGRLYLAERIWVPVYGNLRTLILNEAHATRTLKTLGIISIARYSRVEIGEYHNRLHNQVTDGQSERTIQTLEDMLRACVIDFGGNCDTHLP